MEESQKRMWSRVTGKSEDAIEFICKTSPNMAEYLFNRDMQFERMSQYDKFMYLVAEYEANQMEDKNSYNAAVELAKELLVKGNKDPMVVSWASKADTVFCENEKKLETLQTIRSVIEDLDDIKVLAIVGKRVFDITDYCPMEISITDMQPVIENMDDAIVTLKCELGHYDKREE